MTNTKKKYNKFTGNIKTDDNVAKLMNSIESVIGVNYELLSSKSRVQLLMYARFIFIFILKNNSKYT